jgi:hypothetical protein
VPAAVVRGGIAGGATALLRSQLRPAHRVFSPGEAVEHYRFHPDDLAPARRRPGISLFMRIRNGAPFLEAAIRSHLPHVDEIVAVYNRCTDDTPQILSRLVGEFGSGRLRVFHYLPAVHPPGSQAHALEPADSPHSLVNYYNFALSRTRYSHAAKLDDDHVAIGPALAAVTARLRAGGFPDDEMVCFSGPNLARDASGAIGVLAGEPFSGNGDIGFFRVTADTYFVRDRRFERFRRGSLRRRFRGFLYWHLKYLKDDLGFANYELAANPDSRYAAKRARLLKAWRVVPLAEVGGLGQPLLDRALVAVRRLGAPLGDKLAFRADRWLATIGLDVPQDAAGLVGG